MNERRVRPGWEDKVPRTSIEFQQAYLASDERKRIEAEINDFQGELEEQVRLREANRGESSEKRNYTVSFPEQVRACTVRQFRVLIGDPLSLFGKVKFDLHQYLLRYRLLTRPDLVGWHRLPSPHRRFSLLYDTSECRWSISSRRCAVLHDPFQYLSRTRRTSRFIRCPADHAQAQIILFLSSFCVCNCPSDGRYSFGRCSGHIVQYNRILDDRTPTNRRTFLHQLLGYLYQYNCNVQLFPYDGRLEQKS